MQKLTNKELDQLFNLTLKLRGIIEVQFHQLIRKEMVRRGTLIAGPI